MTWMPLSEFQQLFPKFQLEDELFVRAGRDVIRGPKTFNC
jgi:transcriptional regulator GlxA family with amidase domain